MKITYLALSIALLPLNALAKAETYKIDIAASKATWMGSKLVGKHDGELKVKGGELVVEKGALTGGNVEIDMTSLTNKDLTDPGMNSKLVTHLKSEDFFSVEKNPVSSLKITKVEKNNGKTVITGDLTIKGITKPVSFPVELKVNKKGLQAKGEMTVDRTEFDIKFRSLKFFSDIGDKVIDDKFKVGFDVATSK